MRCELKKGRVTAIQRVFQEELGATQTGIKKWIERVIDRRWNGEGSGGWMGDRLSGLLVFQDRVEVEGREVGEELLRGTSCSAKKKAHKGGMSYQRGEGERTE